MAEHFVLCQTRTIGLAVFFSQPVLAEHLLCARLWKGECGKVDSFKEPVGWLGKCVNRYM